MGRRKRLPKDIYLVVCEEGVVYATEDEELANDYVETRRTQSITSSSIALGLDGDEDPTEIDGELYEVVYVSLGGKKSGDEIFYSGRHFEDSISYDCILDVFN